MSAAGHSVSATGTAGGAGATLRAAAAGTVVGIDLLGRAVAFALLAYAGPLAAGIDGAVVIFLLSGMLATLAALPLMPAASIFGAVQSAPLVILLPSLATVAAAAEAGLPPPVALATATAILGTTAIATGAATTLLAVFDAGRLVRLMPYPVTAGFLASAGALMIEAALRMILSAPGAAGPTGFDQGQAVTLALALAFAGAMRLGAKLQPNFGAVAVLVGGTAGFFVLIWLSGMGIDGARATGLLSALPPATPNRAMPPDVGFWAAVDLPLLWHSLPLVAAAVFLSALGMMLNIAGIEMGLRCELRSRNALFGSAGVNLLTGALGSTVSFVSSTSTLIGEHLGGRSRLVAAGAIMVMGLGVALRQEIVAMTPHFVASGLLIYVGFEILAKWFFGQRQALSGADWGVVGGLVVATLLLGMLPALLIGIAASSVFFAATYARLDAVRSVGDLSVRRSTVDRGPHETEVLDGAATEVVTLSLQGFLFFGSADRIVQRIRALIEAPKPPSCVVLDCGAVSGFDAAAVAALRRLEHIAEVRGTTIALAGLKPAAAATLDRQEIARRGDGTLIRAGSADEALQAAEARLIARVDVREAHDDALSALLAATGDETAAVRLLGQMDRQEVAAGEQLIAAGDPSGDVFLIDRGRLAVLAHAIDGRPIRLRSFRPGAVVGEVSAYLHVPRTADVIAEEPSVVYRLCPGRIDRLMAEDPATAALWHRFAARTLAEKLQRTNELVRESTS